MTKMSLIAQVIFSIVFLVFALDNMIFIVFDYTLFMPGLSEVVATVCLLIVLTRNLLERLL